MADVDLRIREGVEDPEELRLPAIPSELSLLPLRESVVFPMLIAPLSVGRLSSVQMIDESITASNRIIGVVAQRETTNDAPGWNDIYHVGCAAIVRTLSKTPDGARMIIQGLARIRLVECIQTEPYLKAKIEVIDEPTAVENDQIEALRRTVVNLFEKCVSLSPQLPSELQSLTSSVEEPNILADLVTAHMPFAIEDKQQVLETYDLTERLRLTGELLGREARVLELTSKVQNEVQTELSKSQREYYLREQLKAIQKELGESEDRDEELEELREKIQAAGMNEEAHKESMREYDRLKRLSPGSPEFSVARTYVDWMISLPWTKQTEDQLDLKKVMRVLDADHFGLEKIKERIVEFLAVRKFKKSGTVRQPILCFVGPPGVGKTSLGRSIAHAMGREFVRVSLGGMRDEAEIRGHRRTYVGAMPGQIIQNVKRVGTNNPVFMLDEVDKLGTDFRGDPSSALLEVLDPEQNYSFRDHYIDSPFDLSKVFFVCTANVLETIPPPLRDRMEVIELGGYTEEEKIDISRKHLIPKQIAEHGLTPNMLSWSRDAIAHLISGYTREAGVRNLERELAAVTRKATRQFAEGRTAPIKVNKRYIEHCLGGPKYSRDEVLDRQLKPGVSVGLAWTPAGGDVLFIEATAYPGTGQLVLTGQLGEVMKESARAALSCARTNAEKYEISGVDLRNVDIHVHVPAGAIQKDGPSAGITMLAAIVGLLSNRRMKPRLAMTGEITLSGHVLPIGGLKEKILAAKRAGIETVMIPHGNQKDYFEDVPEKIRKQMHAIFVKSADDIVRQSLVETAKRGVA
ncbi:MAG: endopeptidase La [Fimbriimonadales bacterium]